MRELMAQEKEKVLRENQQLQDQISVLNDMLQPQQGGRHPDSMSQQQQRAGRHPEPRLRSPNVTSSNPTLALSQTSRSPTPRAAAVPSVLPPVTSAVGNNNNPRHYQNQQQNLQQQQQRQFQIQQQTTRGFAGSPQPSYPLDDREAASLMGRNPIGGGGGGDAPSLSCPFQGIEDLSPGAFSAATNLTFVQHDGASASTTGINHGTS